VSPETLKPCPFCGSDAARVTKGMRPGITGKVTCWNRACVLAHTYMSAEHWNERAATPAGPSGWMPIETAPKDGTRVDLWLMPDTASKLYFMHKDEKGHRVTGAWISSKHPNDKEAGGCWYHQGTLYVEGVESDTYMATHWMPLPPAPTDKAA
jgi:hypothetical protein